MKRDYFEDTYERKDSGVLLIFDFDSDVEDIEAIEERMGEMERSTDD